MYIQCRKWSYHKRDRVQHKETIKTYPVAANTYYIQTTIIKYKNQLSVKNNTKDP